MRRSVFRRRRSVSAAQMSAGVQNIIAPAISATSTIGTQITGDDGTWTGNPTFTYQWQRNTGSFVNIGGATSKNYTPVDADFGYALRLVVTPNIGSAANSNATNLTLEAPIQTVGSELLANPSFETNITGWNAGNSATLSNPAGTRTGGSGTKVLRVARNTTNNPFASAGMTSAIGDIHRLSGWLLGDGTFIPSVRFPNSGTAIQSLLATASWQPFDLVFIQDAAFNSALLWCAATSAGSSDWDDISEKKITPNVELVAPSANMRISQFYTLAASPVVGSMIWMLSRISNFASGNYWLTLLNYNTSNQWDITTYTVASGVRTATAAAATNIGATDGMRLNMNGNLVNLETRTSGVWTARGSQVNNSLYNSAVGVNVIYSPNNAIGVTQYEPAA